MNLPSPNGPDGRDHRGRFRPGNPGGSGNPQAGAVARLRSAMLGSVTEDDMRAIIEKLIEQALEGNVMAIREVLDRTIGKAKPAAEEETGGPVDIMVRYVVNVPGTSDAE